MREVSIDEISSGRTSVGGGRAPGSLLALNVSPSIAHTALCSGPPQSIVHHLSPSKLRGSLQHLLIFHSLCLYTAQPRFEEGRMGPGFIPFVSSIKSFLALHSNFSLSSQPLFARLVNPLHYGLALLKRFTPFLLHRVNSLQQMLSGAMLHHCSREAKNALPQVLFELVNHM